MDQAVCLYGCAGVKAWPGDRVLPSWLKCVSMPWGPGTEHTSRALMKVLHLLTSTLWPPTSFCGNEQKYAVQKKLNKIHQPARFQIHCSTVLECHSGTLDLDLNDPIKTTLMMLEVRETCRIALEERVAQFGGTKQPIHKLLQGTNCEQNLDGMGWDVQLRISIINHFRSLNETLIANNGFLVCPATQLTASITTRC